MPITSKESAGSVLSGGELQRVLLALALRPRPNLLLLDEPSSGIDVRGIEQYYRTVEDVKEHGDLSVILVSHDPDLIRRYADRVVLICRKVVKSGTPDEVLDSPEYRALLG
ncbi:MAG: ATP-binding cassette domain-containing protein [Clostridia bacterium]|nr:ATP-binding cassette domain-containing protein [Clostridia bacterium]